MTQYQPDEKNRIKRQKSELAIRLAKEGRWEDAVLVNRELLAVFPEDSETLNRLGKAYLELKRYGEARAAYELAVKVDRGNSIAQKNLQRLQQYPAVPAGILPLQAGAENDSPVAVVASVGTATSASREKVIASVFIEETGKTGTTSLIHVAPVVTLAKLTAGDAVVLEIVANKGNHVLVVKNQEGEVLGQVEPKMALRLTRFMEAGNRYIANVTSVSENKLEIIIRETYQHPSMRGKLSFPPKTGSAAYRAYTRDSVLRGYGTDEDEEGPDYDNDEDDDNELGEEEAEISDDFADDNESEDI